MPLCPKAQLNVHHLHHACFAKCPIGNCLAYKYVEALRPIFSRPMLPSSPPRPLPSPSLPSPSPASPSLPSPSIHPPHPLPPNPSPSVFPSLGMHFVSPSPLPLLLSLFHPHFHYSDPGRNSFTSSVLHLIVATSSYTMPLAKEISYLQPHCPPPPPPSFTHLQASLSPADLPCPREVHQT